MYVGLTKCSVRMVHTSPIEVHVSKKRVDLDSLVYT